MRILALFRSPMSSNEQSSCNHCTRKPCDRWGFIRRYHPGLHTHQVYTRNVQFCLTYSITSVMTSWVPPGMGRRNFLKLAADKFTTSLSVLTVYMQYNTLCAWMHHTFLCDCCIRKLKFDKRGVAVVNRKPGNWLLTTEIDNDFNRLPSLTSRDDRIDWLRKLIDMVRNDVIGLYAVYLYYIMRALFRCWCVMLAIYD